MTDYFKVFAPNEELMMARDLENTPIEHLPDWLKHHETIVLALDAKKRPGDADKDWSKTREELGQTPSVEFWKDLSLSEALEIELEWSISQKHGLYLWALSYSYEIGQLIAPPHSYRFSFGKNSPPIQRKIINFNALNRDSVCD